MPEDAGFDRHELRTVALRFQEAIPRTALLQVAATFPPLLALLAAMHVGLALGCWPVLALALPAAGLVVRVFALQHDCGHGSLFRSRRANDAVGRLCSLFTLTPYGHWRRRLCHGNRAGAQRPLDSGRPHAAAAAARHCAVASARKARSVRREIRWRWTLNVL